MIKEQITALLKPYKGIIIVLLLGVCVPAGLVLRSRYLLNQATQHEVEAERLRGEADGAFKEAIRLKEFADKLSVDLQKANAKLEKLQTAVDKIQVPPKPGPAPEQKQQLIADLQAMGLELVVKPSTTIAPSLVGITERDGKAIWGWGKENLRVPFLEQKVEAQGNLIAGLEKTKTLAEKLAEARTKEADLAFKSADLHKQEANNLRVVVDAGKKALANEKRKRILYGVGAVATGYVVGKKLAH